MISNNAPTLRRSASTALSLSAWWSMTLLPFSSTLCLADDWKTDPNTGLEMNLSSVDLGSTISHRLNIRSSVGVIHIVERSTDLVLWQEVGRHYGFGQTITLEMFRSQKSDAPPAPPVVEPPRSYPEPSWKATIWTHLAAPSIGGGIIANWSALDGSGVRTLHIPAMEMPTDRPAMFSIGEWQEIQVGHSAGAPMLSVPASPSLTGADAAVSQLLQADLPALAAVIMQQISSEIPSAPQPAPNTEKGFLRTRTITNIDSDSDGLSDALELANGSSPFSPDTDGDGISDAEELALGTSPTLRADLTDSDGDGLLDNEDADPGDSAICWKKCSTPHYIAIPIGNPYTTSELNDANLLLSQKLGLLDLSEDGKILASITTDQSEYLNDVLAPPASTLKTRVWLPSTGQWSTDLAMGENLRVTGSSFDGAGNILGEGFAALGSDKTFPGTKRSPAQWFWNPTTSSYDSATPAGPPDPEIGSAFSSENGAYAFIPFQGDDNILNTTAGYDTHIFSTEHPPQDHLESSLLKFHTYSRNTITPLTGYPNTTSAFDTISLVGSPSGWYAYSVTPDNEEGNQPTTHHLQRSQAWNEPDTTQSTTWNPPQTTSQVSKIASIKADLRRPTDLRTVIWHGDNNNLIVGSNTNPASNTLTWQSSSRTPGDPRRLRGKLNARGEALTSTHLWRNAKSIPLADLIPNTDWTNLHAIDHNDSGTILATATNTTTNKTSPILIIPVEVLIPVIDSTGQVVDNQFVNANELKVAKWEKAFTGKYKSGNADIKSDFIDWDRDRFFIRIPNGKSLGITSIEVGTTDNPDDKYNDRPTELSLVSDIEADAISASIILVSNEDDDSYAGSGAGVDNTFNDRTHIVQLGGNFHISSITINSTKVPVDFRIPVPAKKQLHINFYRMKGVPKVFSPDQVKSSIERLKELYAQVGLEIIEHYSELDWPSGVENSAGPGFFEVYTYLQKGDNVGPLTDAYKKFPNDTQTATNDTNIYYLTYAYTKIFALGIAISKKQLDHDSNLPGEYINKAFIHDSRAARSGVPAHELLHLLAFKSLDESDHKQTFFNLLFVNNLSNSKVLQSKRINLEQEKQIHLHNNIKDTP